MNRPKLEFLCVGPQRTATSWLDRVLRTHPEIALPNVVKETFFFDQRFDRGWDWYWREHYSTLGLDAKTKGEIAPTVFDNPGAIDRLRAHNAQARIVVCIRDPLERTQSLYRHYHAISRVGDDFSEAVQRHPEIVNASRYKEHIARWVGAFGAERVLLVPHAAVESDPLGTVNAVYDFLGVSRTGELPEAVRQPYGAVSVPRNRWLAMVAHRVARILRKHGLHAVANVGKSMGLKAFFLGGGRSELPPLPADCRQALEREFEQDSQFSEVIRSSGVITAAQAAQLLFAKAP